MVERSKSGKAEADFRFLYLTQAARHALMGMRSLARSRPRGFGLAADCARRARLPAGSLAKVFQRLAARGLLTSQRGPGGGYALSRPASQIMLADILRAVHEIAPGGEPCLLGNRPCGDGGWCPVHRVVAAADRKVLEGFRALSLEAFARSEGWA